MPPKSSSKNRSRKVADIHTNLDESLKAYATAAAAAGMGLLTFSHPAEAKVVFTPSHQTLLPGGLLKLDLNGDGINDFSITDIHIKDGSLRSNGYVDARPSMASNQIIHGSNFDSEAFAQALATGVKVGSKDDFVNYPQLMAYCVGSGGVASHKIGRWANATDRFLGLKFVINGQPHFGWARFTVRLGTDVGCQFKVVLSGYAYETVVNKPITTGQTVGAAEATAYHSTSSSKTAMSLWTLALGAPGLAVWQREADTVL